VFLKALMGTPVTVTSLLHYTHTFKPRTTDFSVDEIGAPITAWKNMADAGSMFVYTNLIATRGEFSCSNGEFLRMSLDVVGGTVGSQVASASLGTAVGKNWTWDVTSFELGGAANTELQNLTVIIDEQATPKWTLRTSKDAARVKRDARRQIRVNGTIRFRDQVEYNNFITETSQALKVTFTGTVVIQSGYYDVFQVIVPSFKYLTYPAAFPDAAELLVSFEGKAEYHTGSATAVAFVVVNSFATI
jgi:hypothetical protein